MPQPVPNSSTCCPEKSSRSSMWPRCTLWGVGFHTPSGTSRVISQSPKHSLNVTG
ncbi:MAG: hypothetical protein ACYSW1_14840 [Planctomycetota bacterium]|jgi:hypothetical protein